MFKTFGRKKQSQLMPSSEFVLLDGETVLMVLIRSMELLSTTTFVITIRLIHAHSGRSLGFFKYCLYQIVAWSFVSHMCTILGPVFVLPLIGAYHYIDFTDNPSVIHGILCGWIMICAFDIQSILDGFNYRLRVLLVNYYPTLAHKNLWMFATVAAKLSVIVLVGALIAPFGKKLNRVDMRKYLLDNYPNVVEKFDEYSSFVVYDMDRMNGFRQCMIMLAIGAVIMALYGIMIVSSIFKILHLHRDQMSQYTRRLHARFVMQLSFQASVPLVVLVCPLIALLLLALIKVPFQNNFPGYALTGFMILHGPLTSTMTIALNIRYRQAVMEFFHERILRRRRGHSVYPIRHSVIPGLSPAPDHARIRAPSVISVHC